MIKLFVLLFSLNSQAGLFVSKSLYVDTYLVIGNGKTLEAAKKDAMSAIPKATKYLYYEANTNWSSPALQCVDNLVWSEKDECGGGLVQYELPLKKVMQ
jgi:hypothetical protein